MLPNKQQFGFSIVVLILAMSAVAGISATGWYVFKTHKPAQSPISDTAVPTTIKAKTRPRIPDGYKEYASKSLGIVFNYPATWGTPKSSATSAKKGEQYIIRFSSFPEAETNVPYVAVETADFEPTNEFQAFATDGGIKDYDKNHYYGLLYSGGQDDSSARRGDMTIADEAHYYVVGMRNCAFTTDKINIVGGSQLNTGRFPGIEAVYSDATVVGDHCHASYMPVANQINKEMAAQIKTLLSTVDTL